MKWTFVIIMSFMLLMGLAGCNSKCQKVTINFKFDSFSYLVEVDKGMPISDDIIAACQMKNIKLYYDKDFLTKYNNEPIEKDIDIYLKLFIEKSVSLVDKAREAYLNKFIKPGRVDAVIEDVWLYSDLGTYNGNFVGVFLDRKHSIFIDLECKIIIEDIVILYSYGYDIYVYDGTDLMDLLTAYNQAKLTYENIVQIYRLQLNLDE